MIFLNTINEIAGALKLKDLSVFCGAGISYNSGLPLVSNLLDYMFNKLGLAPGQVDSILSSNLPFESIMESVLRESELDDITAIFKEGKPSASHTFLAKLAAAGYIRIICTTNFDTLIEDAMQNEGMVREKDFRVYSTEDDLNHINWKDDNVHLIKIHGCITQSHEMAITMQLIASARYTETRQKILEKIFGGSGPGNVLVIGYSCSDLDLTPLIESFKEAKVKVFFLEHQATAWADAVVLPVSEKELKNPFKEYAGLRILIDTDKFIKALWNESLTDKYPNVTQQRIAWKTYIDVWYDKSVACSGRGVKHHISARLLYDIGEFNEAIGHNKDAIAIALVDNNLLAYSSETGNMAMALNAIGEFEQAKSCLSESIPLCRRINNLQGLSSQLQALGKALHELHEDEKAIKVYTEALNIARQDNNEDGVCCVLGNISNSYNRLGRIGDARSSLDEALTLSRKLGNKQAESSQLGIIAYTYFLLGNYPKAIESCTQGIAIKRLIGDRHGECQLLCNLISLYRECGETAKAMGVAQDCLKVARSLRNKAIENMTLLNIALLD